MNHPDLISNLLGGENFVPKNFDGDSDETGDPSAINEGVSSMNLSFGGYDLKGKCYLTDSRTGIKHEVAKKIYKTSKKVRKENLEKYYGNKLVNIFNV